MGCAGARIVEQGIEHAPGGRAVVAAALQRQIGPDRRYTPEFRDAAVKQVIEGGRPVAAVARSLEMSNKSLANWVYRARKGQQLVKRAPAQPVSELEAELSRLRQENAKLRLEKEVLKKAAAYFAKESM
jgi:transposase